MNAVVRTEPVKGPCDVSKWHHTFQIPKRETFSARWEIVQMLRTLMIQHTKYPTSEQYNTLCSKQVMTKAWRIPLEVAMLVNYFCLANISIAFCSVSRLKFAIPTPCLLALLHYLRYVFVHVLFNRDHGRSRSGMPSRTFEETALMKMCSLEVHRVAKKVVLNHPLSTENWIPASVKHLRYP